MTLSGDLVSGKARQVPTHTGDEESQPSTGPKDVRWKGHRAEVSKSRWADCPTLAMKDPDVSSPHHLTLGKNL